MRLRSKILHISGFNFLLLSVLLRLAPSPSADLSFVILALFATYGKAQAVMSILVSGIFMLLNPALLPSAKLAEIGRYVVLFAALKSALTRKSTDFVNLNRSVSMTVTICLVIFIIFHSLLISEISEISLFKILAWSLTIGILIKCWSGIDPHERYQLEELIFVVLVLIALASVPLLAIGAGREVNGTGFQGVLGHPQAFGIIIGFLGTWSTLTFLDSPTTPMSIIAASSYALVILSGARTAFFSMIVGLLATFIIIPILTRRRLASLLPGLHHPLAIPAALFIILGLIATSSSLEGVLTQFINKGRQFDDLTEAYADSRGKLIEIMLMNIDRNFYSGIGFGIASDPYEMKITRDPIFGIPISAVIEKGALPFAVFEELGLFGFLIFILWMITVTFRASRSGVVPLALTLVFIALNFGESTLFSAGGAGIVGLIFLTWALTGNHEIFTNRNRSNLHSSRQNIQKLIGSDMK